MLVMNTSQRIVAKSVTDAKCWVSCFSLLFLVSALFQKNIPTQSAFKATFKQVIENSSFGVQWYKKSFRVNAKK